MAESRRFFRVVVSATVAVLAIADVFGSPPNPGCVKRFRWNDSGAEAAWEHIIQTSERLSLQPRMKNADGTQAEGQLEAFGTRYMPNAYAQYQETRAQALEFEQTVKESFPQGKLSDPTGGTMFDKANKKLAEAVARAFRRRDELCFFLLFHQAGIFSEDMLAKYDSRPISIRLEPESDDWPDDTPEGDMALAGEDATFAAKYLPETHAGYRRLCRLFDEGTKQYDDLRRTALALDAPRARCELIMIRARLYKIGAFLLGMKNFFSVERLKHAFEETSAGSLAALDQDALRLLQGFEREMGMKAYIARMATRLFVTLPGGATMEMVWCPPGSFMRGHEGNQHGVTLTEGFWMAKTEVTQKQWTSVMGNNPSYFEGDDLPVESVSWDACQEFCKKAGLQLPTEAQWEYACRAESSGPIAGSGCWVEMGWYRENSGEKTHPVGTKLPNAWGLCDMHGNVSEWCQDYWLLDYPDQDVTDPQGPDKGMERVERGGSWRDSVVDCTSDSRSTDFSYHANSNDGFRPVFSAEAEQAQLESQKEKERVQREVQAKIAATNGKMRAGESRKPGEPKTITLPGGARMEMVWCPPGAFLMGSPDYEQEWTKHETQHQVTLTKGFWMAKTEVTQAQWKSVMGNNPSGFKGDSLPVECVSWNDCQEFCQKAGLALPTEAQWEYACRAGSTGAHSGSGAWIKDNSGDQTHPAGQKKPNAWGLHDMYGNVLEWCADWYDANYYAQSPGSNPTGPVSGEKRVFRGGDYRSDAEYCRSAFRFGTLPTIRVKNMGFRPVMNTQ